MHILQHANMSRAFGIILLAKDLKLHCVPELENLEDSYMLEVLGRQLLNNN